MRSLKRVDVCERVYSFVMVLTCLLDKYVVLIYKLVRLLLLIKLLE